MSEEARPHFRAGIGELLPVKGGAGIDDALGKNDPTIAVCVRLAVEKKQIDYFRLALAAPASAGMRARCAVILPRSLRAGTPMRSAPWAAIVAISAQRIHGRRGKPRLAEMRDDDIVVPPAVLRTRDHEDPQESTRRPRSLRRQ